jgi:tetratricopeptide (TPR) repeat protein
VTVAPHSGSSYTGRLARLLALGVGIALLLSAWPAIQVNRAFLVVNRWPSLFAPDSDPTVLIQIESQLSARPDQASATRILSVVRRLNGKPASLPAEELIHWGRQQQKLGNNDAAHFLFAWATEEDPGNGDAWLFLAQAISAGGSSAENGRLARDAGRWTMDEDGAAYQAVQTALATGRFSTAELQAAAHYQAGEWLWFHEGNLLAALPYYQSAVALNPADHWAGLRLGVAIYWGQGDLERATAEIERVIAGWQDERYLQWPYFYLGEILADAGRIDEAITAYERVLALDPAESRVAARLADLRDQLSEPQP